MYRLGLSAIFKATNLQPEEGIDLPEPLPPDLHQAIRALLLAARVMVLPEFATYCVSNQSQIGVKTHLINGA